jgi:2'-5' RNA ligase
MNALPAATWRLFLGLWPTPEVREQLVAHAAEWRWTAGARRTGLERLHATLHFIGEVEVERIAALRQALDVPWPGCTLVLDRPQVWPGGIAVLEAGEVPPALAQLHAQLAERLLASGLAVETRRYRPHVTFARKAQGSQPPAPAAPIVWELDRRYLLVRSLPGGRGYEAVQVFG